MFRLLVFFTISIFVFNVLSPSYAQEPSVQEQAQTDVKKDIGPIHKSDFFSTSAIMGCLGCIVGSYAGLRIGSSIDNTGTGVGGYFPSDAQFYGCCGGAVLLGSVLPFLFIQSRSYKPIPPTERLLGKSPAYIEAYTQAYESEAIKLSKEYGTIGVIIGNLTSIGAGLCLLGAIVNN